MNKKVRFLILFFFLLIILPVLIIFLQQKQDTRPHAAGNTSLYPANIELDGNNSYGTWNQTALNSAQVGATDIRLDWIDVEPQQGQFNWQPLDNEIAAWASRGKKYVLVVRFIHESFSGTCTTNPQYLPSWELQKLQAANLVFCSNGGAYIPDYFSQTFQNDFFAYLSAIKQHIGATQYASQLLYIRVGLGAGGEGYPCLGCSLNDTNQLASWGFSQTAWKNWQQMMFSHYIQIFSPMILIYPLGYNTPDPQTQQPIDQELAFYALQQGMGIGQEGLSPKPGYLNEINFFAQMRKQFPNAYLQLGTIFAVHANATPPTCDDSCVVQTDIQRANTAGAFSIEWYPQDAGNALFQNYFSTWQQLVNARTSTLTPTSPVTQPSTPSPSPSVTPIVSSKLTQTPTPTPNQSTTTLAVSIGLHGFGVAGTNSNSHAQGNSNPVHPTRPLLVTIIKGAPSTISTQSGQITYNQTTGFFTGTISLSNIKTGDYIIKVKSNGF